MKQKEQLEEYEVQGMIDMLTKSVIEINNLRNEIGISLESEDARQVGLRGIQNQIVPVIAWLKTLLFFAEKDNINNLPIFVGIKMPTKELQYHMEYFIRAGLQTGCHFRVESLFYNLLVALDPTKTTLRGFEKICNALIDKVSVSDREMKKTILKVLSAIRNSSHNNGIHNNATFQVQIKDRTYQFIKGEPVMCASLIDTSRVIDLYIEILKEVLNSPEIKSTPSPIIDLYTQKVDPVTSEEFEKL